MSRHQRHDGRCYEYEARKNVARAEDVMHKVRIQRKNFFSFSEEGRRGGDGGWREWASRNLGGGTKVWSENEIWKSK